MLTTDVGPKNLLTPRNLKSWLLSQLKPAIVSCVCSI